MSLDDDDVSEEERETGEMLQQYMATPIMQLTLGAQKQMEKPLTVDVTSYSHAIAQLRQEVSQLRSEVEELRRKVEGV